MSRTAADLEIDMIVACEALKRGAAYVDLPDWGRRLMVRDGGIIVSTPAVPTLHPAPATPEVVHAATHVSEDQAQIGALFQMLQEGNYDGVQQILAGAGVKLVPIDQPTGVTNDEPNGQDPTA